MVKQFDIVPTEILHKEFSGSLMGYNKVQVEEFLETVANHVDKLQKMILKLEEEKNKLNENKKPLTMQEKLREDMIGKALILAEQTKEQILNNANKEAENTITEAETHAKKMVTEAELHAQKIIAEAKNSISLLEQQISELEEHKRQFLTKFKVELENMLSGLKSTEDDENGYSDSKSESNANSKTEEELDALLASKDNNERYEDEKESN